MNQVLEKQIRNSFGFNPAVSQHHFMVDIRPSTLDPVYISEHISWDDNVGSCATTLDNRLDGQLRVLLPRVKWDAIADEVGKTLNARLRRQGAGTGQWRPGPNLLRRDLGKELVLLAWALEEADNTLIPAGLANWKGLLPEERWWLYTQTAAASGHATLGRHTGWRMAVRYAITENPLQVNANKPREYYLRALNQGPRAEVDNSNARQDGLFAVAEPAADGDALPLLAGDEPPAPTKKTTKKKPKTTKTEG